MFHAAFGRANPHIHATGNIPVNHFHCPNDCEHPQPFLQNNKWFCGRCYCKYGELVECHPCTTNNC
jgi:hypothetical protein